MSEKVNKKNLRRLAWQKGFHGVAGLARHLGHNRCVLHHAVNNPRRYGRLMKKLENVLL